MTADRVSLARDMVRWPVLVVRLLAGRSLIDRSVVLVPVVGPEVHSHCAAGTAGRVNSAPDMVRWLVPVVRLLVDRSSTDRSVALVPMVGPEVHSRRAAGTAGRVNSAPDMVRWLVLVVRLLVVRLLEDRSSVVRVTVLVRSADLRHADQSSMDHDTVMVRVVPQCPGGRRASKGWRHEAIAVPHAQQLMVGYGSRRNGRAGCRRFLWRACRKKAA